MSPLPTEQRYAIAIANEDIEGDVIECMQQLGWQLSLRALSLTQLLTAVSEGIEAVFVGGDRPDGASLVELIERGVKVIGVVDSSLAAARFQAYGVTELIQYEMRSRAQLVKDLDVLFGRTLVARNRQRKAGGRLIAIAGAAGSPGRTCIALNLAMESADLGRLTLLAEVDREGGTLAQQLGLINITSSLQRALATHLPIAQVAPAIASNFHALTAPLPARLMNELDPVMADQLWQRARSEFEMVLVDVGSVSGLFDLARARRRVERLQIDVLTQADEVIMVAAVDPQSVARTHRALDALSGELPDLSFRVVANRVPPASRRHGQNAELADDEVSKAFADRPVAIHRIPLDAALFRRALYQGRAIAELAPRSPVRKAIRTLAQDVCQRNVA